MLSPTVLVDDARNVVPEFHPAGGCDVGQQWQGHHQKLWGLRLTKLAPLVQYVFVKRDEHNFGIIFDANVRCI